jgi:hypothetical protein
LSQILTERFVNANPLQTPSADEPGTLRVDLRGKVIRGDSEGAIPVHSGLYHNPEQVGATITLWRGDGDHADGVLPRRVQRAGYTLAQLRDFSRSTDRRQRLVALHTWGLFLRDAESLAHLAPKPAAALPAELPLVIRAGK